MEQRKIEAVYEIQNNSKYWKLSITQINLVYYFSDHDQDFGLAEGTEFQKKLIIN